MIHNPEWDKMDRPLNPQEYLLALIWAKDITYEPNDPKNKGR